VLYFSRYWPSFPDAFDLDRMHIRPDVLASARHWVDDTCVEGKLRLWKGFQSLKWLDVLSESA